MLVKDGSLLAAGAAGGPRDAGKPLRTGLARGLRPLCPVVSNLQDLHPVLAVALGHVLVVDPLEHVPTGFDLVLSSSRLKNLRDKHRPSIVQRLVDVIDPEQKAVRIVLSVDHVPEPEAALPDELEVEDQIALDVVVVAVVSRRQHASVPPHPPGIALDPLHPDLLPVSKVVGVQRVASAFKLSRNPLRPSLESLSSSYAERAHWALLTAEVATGSVPTEEGGEGMAVLRSQFVDWNSSRTDEALAAEQSAI
eukprot:727249-Hanusia_phi.AAC.12